MRGATAKCMNYSSMGIPQDKRQVTKGFHTYNAVEKEVETSVDLIACNLMMYQTFDSDSGSFFPRSIFRLTLI